MRIILVLVIILSAVGFFGLHKYSQKKYEQLNAQFRKERDNNEELKKSIAVLQQKLQLESMKLQELIKKQQKEDDSQRLADEKEKAEQAKREREQKIADRKKELDKLKQKLESIGSAAGPKLVDIAAINNKINQAKQGITQREQLLRKINSLVNNIKFTCFDMCINGTDIVFERKMTRTCRSTVSGGIYFCEHYDMLGNDFCTRHRHHHKSWKFPNRYRDDHITAVRYYCRQHKTVWDKETANTYLHTHRNSRAILGNQMKYRREIRALHNNIRHWEAQRRNASVRNAAAKRNYAKNSEAIEKQREEINEKIAAVEKEIAELEKAE